MSNRLWISIALAAIGAGVLVAAASAGRSASAAPAKSFTAHKTGGTFVAELSTDVDYVDPGLDYLSSGWEIQYALACKLLVPAGCTGEAHIDAPGSEIQVDGKPGGPRLTLPVGVHALAVRSGDSLVRRSLPVLHEKPVALVLRRSEAQLALLTPDEVAQRAVVSAEVPAAPGRRWTRTAGYVAAGAGIVAAGIAVAEGVHSRSMLDQAESGYRSNGNVYRPADLANLQSGNSAARAANVLFATGGVLLASGLLLAFAF